MIEKRFIMLPFEEGNLIFDELKYDFDNEWYDSRLCLKDKEIVDLLNELYEENEQLKQEKDKWKQQCIHFKEMLDDMDIAYLCDEWIYEELKGDVE